MVLTGDSAEEIGPRVQIIYLFPSHFDLLLLNAIDEGLAVFGESARQAIYHLIQENSHMHFMEIPDKLQTFHEALTELFGLGAGVIEKTILVKLREKMGIRFKEHENGTLVDYINEYRNCVSQ